MKAGDFYTTVDYHDDPRWAARAHLLPAAQGPLGGLRMLLRLLRLALAGHSLVLDVSAGRTHHEVLAAACLGLLKPLRPRARRGVVVAMGSMWHRDPGLRGTLQGLVVRLADRAIDRYVVQSTAELSMFPATWGVSAGKLNCALYFWTILPKDMDGSAEQGVYVFAGGNSQRDYTPLVQAAQALPDVQFVLATRLLDGNSLPPNITTGQVTHSRFMQLMRGASVVVTPIRSGLTRAAGQQTYLNAMWLGKLSVVNDVPGVRDHIVHGETGLIVEGTPESYVEALRFILDPANNAAVCAIAERGQHVAQEQFTFENHVTGVLQAVDAAQEALQSVL